MKMPDHKKSSLSVKRLFSFILLIMPFGVVYPVVVDDLYIAEVLVADESPGQLRDGARAGLLQVLVRVSGSLKVEESSLVRSSLRNPAAYYYQYSYETTDKTLLLGEREVNAKILRLHFEPSAIALLLRDANLPIWGSNRPSVLLWVAVNEGQSRRILGEADSSEIVEALVDQAKQRGLPLTFPILDIEDASKVSTAEVWGSFLERIDGASGRYNPDSVLTARIQSEPGDRWSGRWSYRAADAWESLESAGFSADELVRSMVNQLADELAGKFALGSSRASIRLRIEDIVDVSQYAAVSRYLEELTPVVSSSIVALDGDVAEFELQTEGQYLQLIEIIELDERLLLLGKDERNERLTYRWIE
ncbi:MAG: DUF2066 domain-containing protein [Proteobacteria bacterium]|nr:DUF2066 domain-containing protein [Pseudomonadota bacterium]